MKWEGKLLLSVERQVSDVRVITSTQLSESTPVDIYQSHQQYTDVRVITSTQISEVYW